MNLKELLAHVIDNVNNDRREGHGLLYRGKATISHTSVGIDWEEPSMYTLSPKTVLINGIECVAGMTEAPEIGERYVVASLIPYRYKVVVWASDLLDASHIADGIAFPDTSEGIKNAKVMGNAMITFGEVK